MIRWYCAFFFVGGYLDDEDIPGTRQFVAMLTIVTTRKIFGGIILVFISAVQSEPAMDIKSYFTVLT
jgi:hypothetical protein